MTDRKEPTLFQSLMGAKARASHNAIASEALQGFMEAQEKMSTAIATINKDIADDEAEVSKLQRQIEESGKSLSHLERVSLRFKELLA